ncbi:MAG TPA: hypothetical protein VK203_30720 [Nostocaceae cyanobacterium]|nr:hypothetical protein [Nostocaceae cyanobacterium]
MSKIKISEIKPTGIELFTDSESLMQDLNSDEMGNITGGIAVTEPYTYNPGPCLPLSPYGHVPETVVLPLPYCAVIL